MKLEDAREIQADPATVWSAILDPEILKTCIPGCEELTGNVEDGFDAIVVQKVGPVKAKFNGRVTVSDIEEGERLTLSGHGKGGPAGFASGEAVVRLEQIDADSTRLHYAVDALMGSPRNWPINSSNASRLGWKVPTDQSPNKSPPKMNRRRVGSPDFAASLSRLNDWIDFYDLQNTDPGRNRRYFPAGTGGRWHARGKCGRAGQGNGHDGSRRDRQSRAGLYPDLL